MVADEEALHRQPLAWMASARLRGPGDGLGGVVVGDGAADRDAAAEAQRADRGLEVVAADVVEVDVDAVGRRLAQQVGDAAVLVVERGVEAEVARQVARPSRASRRCR